MRSVALIVLGCLWGMSAGALTNTNVNSRDGRMPNYYLDADVVAFVAEPEVEEAGAMRAGGNFPRRPKRPAQW